MGDAPRWFQLYWSQSTELALSFVRRAEASGCDALVLTLDTTALGWRPRDLDLAYLPFLRGKGLAQYTSDPVFGEQVAGDPDTFERNAGRVTPAAVATLVQIACGPPGRAACHAAVGRTDGRGATLHPTFSKASLNWDDVAFLREHTDLRCCSSAWSTPTTRAGPPTSASTVYGVEPRWAPDRRRDRRARRAAGRRGGRRRRPEVLFDSGIRCGADIFKALALVARAVCLGRPYVHGLALAGGRGHPI